MPDQRLTRSSLAVPMGHTQCEADASEDKRQYNREFMRRWRADPLHAALEREKRRQRYYDGQKQRRLNRLVSSAQSSGRKGKMCGFCWKRPAREKIVRLQVCERASDGYVKVRIPYCGEC